ncbi:MAG: NAD(P)H-hydrate dehydratase [Candidatus Baltobacteraceae bacterium]
MIVLTPAQMRDADAAACERVGATALMRGAGAAIASAVRRFSGGSRIAAFAGPGNNGGDAFAALADLENVSRTIYAQTATAPSEARADAEDRAAKAGVRVLPFPETPAAMREAVNGCDVVIVALFGTGARLPLPPALAALIDVLNAHDAPCIAVDVPPGLDAETGAVREPALRAAATVAIGAVKSGLLLADRRIAGEIIVAPIGFPQDLLAAQERTYAALDNAEFLALLPARGANADKRSAGAPLVIAGSAQFPGAAVLCAMGAARAGAGYVTAAAPKAAAQSLRAHLIEQVVVTIDEGDADRAVSALLDLSRRSGAIAAGPGLGLDDRTGAIVRGVLAQTDLPCVADASALFHLSKHLEPLRGKRIVLTPHAGEFARLSGKGTIAPGERAARLREFVDRTGVTTLLKGEPTLIYDGVTMHINTTGTPALATAGTGDVLTGIIATLLAQGLSPADAARVGAYWHGFAGRHAAKSRPRGVIARDVYEALGPCLLALSASSPPSSWRS